MSIPYDQLYEKALEYLPETKIKPNSTWVGILLHSVTDLKEVKAKSDFLWLRCHGRITVRTLKHEYFSRHPLESFDFKFNRRFLEEKTQVKQLRKGNPKKSQVVVLRAFEEDEIDAEQDLEHKIEEAKIEAAKQETDEHAAMDGDGDSPMEENDKYSNNDDNEDEDDDDKDDGEDDEHSISQSAKRKASNGPKSTPKTETVTPQKRKFRESSESSEHEQHGHTGGDAKVRDAKVEDATVEDAEVEEAESDSSQQKFSDEDYSSPGDHKRSNSMDLDQASSQTAPSVTQQSEDATPTTAVLTVQVPPNIGPGLEDTTAKIPPLTKQIAPFAFVGLQSIEEDMPDQTNETFHGLTNIGEEMPTLTKQIAPFAFVGLQSIEEEMPDQTNETVHGLNNIGEDMPTEINQIAPSTVQELANTMEEMPSQINQTAPSAVQGFTNTMEEMPIRIIHDPTALSMEEIIAEARRKVDESLSNMDGAEYRFFEEWRPLMASMERFPYTLNLQEPQACEVCGHLFFIKYYTLFGSNNLPLCYECTGHYHHGTELEYFRKFSALEFLQKSAHADCGTDQNMHPSARVDCITDYPQPPHSRDSIYLSVTYEIKSREGFTCNYPGLTEPDEYLATAMDAPGPFAEIGFSLQYLPPAADFALQTSYPLSEEAGPSGSLKSNSAIEETHSYFTNDEQDKNHDEVNMSKKDELNIGRSKEVPYKAASDDGVQLSNSEDQGARRASTFGPGHESGLTDNLGYQAQLDGTCSPSGPAGYNPASGSGSGQQTVHSTNARPNDSGNSRTELSELDRELLALADDDSSDNETVEVDYELLALADDDSSDDEDIPKESIEIVRELLAQADDDSSDDETVGADHELLALADDDSGSDECGYRNGGDSSDSDSINGINDNGSDQEQAGEESSGSDTVA